ncbi:ANKHD1, partial [Symbiodinium natans]
VKGHLEIARLLLNAGADKNSHNRKAQTALMHASFQGHIDIVRLLLDAGADKSLRDVSGTTALIHASYVGHIDIVRLLLNAGADAHLRCRRLSWTHIFRAKSRVSGCCRTLVPTS